MRARTWPLKSPSSQSALRRPILMPTAKAPSGFRPIGTEGCPTRPRSGASRRSNCSSSSRAAIRPMACAVRPVTRAISALARLPWVRSACNTTRSVNWGSGRWLEARWRSKAGSAALASASGMAIGARRACQEETSGTAAQRSGAQAGADHAFAQNEISPGLQLAGDDDGVSLARALVERKAFHALGLPAIEAQAGQQRDGFTLQRRAVRRLGAADLHVGHRVRYVFGQRQQAGDGL